MLIGMIRNIFYSYHQILHSQSPTDGDYINVHVLITIYKLRVKHVKAQTPQTTQTQITPFQANEYNRHVQPP